MISVYDLFLAENWHTGTDVKKYHPHPFLPPNLEGEICSIHRLCPLQQSVDKKRRGITTVWMAPVAKLGWMAGHIATYKKEKLI